jgi:phosphoribosylformylglycinamidine synthase
VLCLVDLEQDQQRLGGSALLQTYNRLGDVPPDIEDVAQLQQFFDFIQAARAKILAYHDRSDGGMIVTLLEMAFAARVGLNIELEADNPLTMLFNEEVGAVIQLATHDIDAVNSLASHYGVRVRPVARLADDGQVVIRNRGEQLFRDSRVNLQRLWSETSHAMQRLRDNPACADAAYDNVLDVEDSGLTLDLTYDPQTNPIATMVNTGVKPKIAILREQGINGQLEMAAAFARAGFDCVDVHMSDVIAGQQSLREFKGLAACGGFSFGDVFGAGRGWASSILLHEPVRAEFSRFFAREDTFTLGVCNGCQMLSAIREIIPGAGHFPDFLHNHSARFEARVSLVEVMESPSVLLQGMAGSVMPVAVAHGEGRITQAVSHASVRYVDYKRQATERYPYNPNGSVDGVTGLCSEDGRVTIMMPHPERVFRAVTNSWYPGDISGDGAWMRMFYNARLWVG